jgi:hypothetical protein
MVMQIVPRNRLLDEGPLFSVAQITAMFPTPNKPHQSTVTRWMKKGTQGEDGKVIRLEYVRIAGRLLTSEQAVMRFINAQNQQAETAVAG